MSRDFDRAQEMVVASMEYIKVLGFRIRRTEVQRDDWKQVAQSHADEMIKLRQHVDALKAERDAEREALGIQAAKQAGEALGMVEGEGLLCAAKRVVKERDALRAEVADLRGTFDIVHASLGIKPGDHIGEAIEAMKSQRTPTTKQHPVKVGEWVRRTSFENSIGTRIGAIAQVIDMDDDGDYEVAINGTKHCWSPKYCTPCDPPEGAA